VRRPSPTATTAREVYDFPKLTFHEGQSCSAVLCRLEQRENARIKNLRFHDRQGTNLAVELSCEIGGRLFALEHSGIEPFEGHLRLEANAEKHLLPIQTAIHALPNTSGLRLAIPVDGLRDKRGAEAARIRRLLVDWVEEAAPSISVPRGRRTQVARAGVEEGLPFPVLLSRRSGNSGPFSISCVLPENLEQLRAARVRRAYDDKCFKLANWKRLNGARSVLILEENDIFATREDLVMDAILKVDRDYPDRPDEVWLVSTATATDWSVWWIRNDEKYCEDLSIWGDSLSEVNPRDLVSLTGR
jgi:hypothetical protein